MSELSAYHEAGHAFMALYVGARIHSITITPDRDDGPARYADTQILWPQRKRHTKTETSKEIMVALAGPVSEMIHRGEPFHPAMISEWAADWRMAWSAAARIVAEEAQRLAFLEEITIYLYRFFRHDEIWNTVAAIVDELLAHETLEADEVENVYRTWMS